MTWNYYDIKLLPYISVRKGTVVEASYNFLDFTGFYRWEVVGKNVNDLVVNTLRMNWAPECMGYEGEWEEYCYLFTKSLEARQVSIIFQRGPSEGEANLLFIENPDSRLDDIFPFLQQFYLQQTVGVAVFSLPHNILLKANQHFLDFMNPPYNNKENSFGKVRSSIVTGWEGSSLESIWNAVIKTGTPYHSHEYKFTGSQKGEAYWNITLIPIYHKGSLKYVFEMIIDITESVLYRKHTQYQSKIIEQQNIKMEAVIENISDALFIIDDKGNITLKNRAARDLPYSGRLKRADDVICLFDCYDMLGNKLDLNSFPSAQIMKGERLSLKNILVRNGKCEKHFSVSGAPIFDAFGKQSMSVICCREINERVKHEKLIKTQKDQLEAIIENMSDGVFIIYGDNRISLLNNASRNFFFDSDNINKMEDSLKHTQYYDMESNKLGFKELPTFEIMKGQSVKATRLTAKRPDKTLHFSLSGSPIYDENGNFIMAVVCVRDVSEHVEAEERLRAQQEERIKYEKSEKENLEKIMKLKDEFFSFISHEFKTPLTVINSAVQAMESLCKNELTDKAKKYLKRIRQNSFRQLRLVNNLLEISRAEAGYIKLHKKNMDIVVVSRAIAESVALYAKEKDISIVFSTSVNEKVIGIDEEKFERILLNLLSNAIKFTPKGKSINVRLSEAKKRICIEVEDEGVGIPEENLKMIFDRFGQVSNDLTRSSEGTGIGLFLVKLLVKAHGGEISVESRVGEGSRFIITLPSLRTPAKSSNLLQLEIADNRLIHTAAIEFSDIYLN